MNKLKNYISFLIIFGVIIGIDLFGFLDVTPLVSDVSSNLFNIITVGSVFAGFLFTSITFLVGVSETKTVETLERINYMENVYNNLLNGFVSSIISIILCAVGIFIVPQLNRMEFIKGIPIFITMFNKLIPILIISFLGHTIINFIFALNHIKLIIKSIRRKSLKNAPSDESVKKTLSEIK